MKLTKEHVEREIRIWKRNGCEDGTVTARHYFELCRLALLGLEHDRIVAERDARPDISAEDAAHAIKFFRGWDDKGSVTEKVFSALRAHARKAARP